MAGRQTNDRRWELQVPANRWDLLDAGPPCPISVVICYYEAADDLRRLVASLDVQTHSPHQIIVADDGSSQAPAQKVLSDRPDILCLWQPDRGFRAASARNLGAAAATGDVIVFLDGDVVAAPTCLQQLAAVPSGQPQSLTVGRRLHARLDGMTPQAAAAVARRPHDNTDRLLSPPGWLDDGYAATHNLSSIDVRAWRYVISAVMAMDREYFTEVGGFEDSLVSYGGEDWELAHRVLHAGGLLVHQPDAVVVHNGPDLSERPDAMRLKTAETMQLFPLITDRTFRPRSVRFQRPRVLATLHAPGWTWVELLITIDSLLARQPDTAVTVRGWGELPPVLDHDSRISLAADRSDHPHAEVRVDIYQPVLLTAPFDRALGLVDPGGCGWVSVALGDHPAVTMTGLWAQRRCQRVARAGPAAQQRARQAIGSTTLTPEEAGIAPVPPAVTAEAHFDGGVAR